MSRKSWFSWLLDQQSSNGAEHQLDVFELESRLVLNADFSFTGGVLDITVTDSNINLDVDDPGGFDLRFDLNGSGSFNGTETGPIDVNGAGDELRITDINSVDVINLSLDGGESNLTIDVEEQLALGNTEINFSGTTINFAEDGGTTGINSGNDSQTYSGIVIIDDDDTNFIGSTVTFNNTLDAGTDGTGEDLAITGNAVFNGIVGGGSDQFTSLNVSGTTSIGANITVDGEMTFVGAATLTADVTLTGTDGGGDADNAGVEFGSTLTGGGFDLTTSGGGGFLGAVSGLDVYATDTIQTGSTFSAASLTASSTSDLAGDVTTTGTQAYTGAVTTDGAVEFSGSGLTFSSTLTGNDNLTLTGDALSLGGNVSSAGNEILLQPLTNTTSIGLGAAATGTFNLDATELGFLQDGFSGITIGRADGQHAIDFNGFNFSDAITIQTPNGGSIDIGGTGLSTVAGGATANILLDGSGATTTLSADIITAGASVTISDSVVVDGARTIDTTNSDAVAAAAIQIDGAVSGANADGTDTLALDAAQGAVDGTGDANVTLGGNVNGGDGANDIEALAISGAAIQTASLTVDGDITLEGTSVETGAVLSDSGNISYTGATTLNGNVTATTGTIAFNSALLLGANIAVTSTAGNALTFGSVNSTTGNNFSLAANTTGTTTFNGAVGAVDQLSSVTTNAGGTTEINANISTTGNQTYNDAVEIQSDVNLTGNLVDFNSSVANEAGENNALTITGGLETSGALGAVDAFSSVTVTGAATIGGNVNTVNNQSYNTVVINQNTTFTSTNGDISFSSIDSDAGNNRDLTIDAVNGTNSLSGIGVTDAINNLTVNGAVQLGGAITTVGAQDYSAATSIVILDDAILTSTGNSNFTFGTTIDSESGELNALTVNTTGTTTFNGVIGGTDRLSSLTTNAGGTTEIGANINTNGATVTFNDAVILTANTTIDEDGAGNITFNNTVNSSTGNNFSLSTSTAGAGVTVFNGAVGGVDALTSVTVAGGTTLGADITTTNNQLYNGGSILATDIVLTSTSNAFISVNGAVDGTTVGQEALTIVTAGGIQLANGNNVGGNVRLESITANTAGSTTLVAFSAFTTGTQSYNNVQVTGSTTLDGSAINIAGTANPIGATGSLTVVGDLTIVGAVGSVNDLTSLTTTGSSADFQSTITSSGNITITADTLSLGGNVTSPGDVVLQPLNVATSIGLAGGTGTFNLDATELGFLQDGFNSITIGRADGEHVIDFDGFNFSDAITIRTPNGGSIAIDGNLSSVAGGNTADITLDGSGATTTLSADIITAGANITISDSILVDGGFRNIDSTNGNTVAAGDIQIDGTIAGANAGGGDFLDIAAIFGAADGVGDGMVTLLNNITGGDGANDLEGLIIRGFDIETAPNGSLANQTWTVDGAVTIIGAMNLNTNLAITSTSGGFIQLDSTVDGGFDLALNTTGETRINRSLGSTSILATLTTDAGGTTIINDALAATSSIRTTGAQTYNDAVILNQNTQLTASTVDFNSTVDSQATETNSLLVTGNLETSAAIGATDALSSLTVTGNTSLGGNVTTTGQQTYGDTPGSDTTTITADVTLQGTLITFNSTVDADAVANGRDLAITGNLDFNAEVGGTEALQSISVSGTSQIETDVTTVTTQDYTGGVVLSGDTNFTGTTITFTSGVDDDGTQNSLTITGDLVTTSIGGTIEVDSILVTGTSQFSSIFARSLQGQTYQGNVTTTGATISFTSNNNGDINFDGNLTGTNTALSVSTGTGTINLGNDAADVANGLASLDLDAENVSLANVTVAGTSDIDISGSGALTQISNTAFISPNLLLTGDGTFTLTEATNNFNVLAAAFITSGGTGGDASDGNVPGGEVPANYEFNIFDADNLTIGTVNATSGITTAQRDVRVETVGNLFVNEVVNTSPGGSGDLFIDGATIAATPVVGNGDITLIGGSPDLLILADTTSNSNMTLEADRDVIIRANVSSTAGANILINANNSGGSDVNPGDNQGGVLIDTTGTVTSDGNLTINGTQLFNDPDGVGPLVDNDPNNPGVVIHGVTDVAGDLTVTTDTIDITANISAGGNMLLQPFTVTQDIFLATTEANGGFNLTATELDFIQDGSTGITFGRADGEHNITQGAYNYRDAITLNAPVAGTISIIGNFETTAGAVDSTASVLIDGSGATTVLGANIITGGAPVTISDSVLVDGGNRLIQTTDGDSVAAANIQIDGTIAGANAGGSDVLVLDAAQGFVDGVGEANITLGDEVNGADGPNDLETLVMFGNVIDLQTNTVAANVDGTFNVFGITVDLNAVNAESIDVNAQTGSITLNANTNSAQSQSFNGPVILATDIVATDTTGGNIQFIGGTASINATTAGVESLTVNTAGTTIFGGPVGNTNALSSLTTDAPGVTAMNSNVTTTGQQNYNDAVQLSGDITLTAADTDADGEGVEFASTLNSAFVAQDLTIVGGGQFNGAVGSGIALDVFNADNIDTESTFAATSVNVTGTSDLGGNVTTSSFQTYGGAVTLTADVITASTAAGAITFNSTIDSSTGNLFSLTANTAGVTRFSAAIGGTDNLSSLSTDASGQTLINTGTINTNGNGVSLNDAVLLQTDVVFTEAGAGNVAFNGTVDAADNTVGGTSNFGLTINTTTGSAIFNGTVGGDALGALSDPDGLEFLTVNGPASIGANITTTGEQVFDGDVTLTSNVTLTGNDTDADTFDIEFLQALFGNGFDLTIVNCGLFVGAAAGIGNFVAGGFTTESTFQANTITTTGAGCDNSLHGDVTTVGGQSYTGAVILSSDVVLASTGGGDITFVSTVDSSTGNNFALTVNTTGNTQFSGVVGGNDALSSLTVSGTATLNANVTTTGEQNYNGAVTLTNNISLTGVDTDADGEAIDFGSTLDGAQNLVIFGGAQFNGNVGSTTALTSLNVNGTSLIGGNVTTTGTQTFAGAAELSANAIFNGTSTTFSSTLDSTPGNNFAATFNSALVTNAAVGGTDALSSLIANNTASLGGNVTTTGNQTFNAPATLTTSVVLTSTGTGDIFFNNTLDGTTDGVESLTVNTAGRTVISNSGFPTGQTVRLASITTDAPGRTDLFGNITTTGTQTYNDTVRVGNSPILTGTTITFGGTVDAGFGNTLTINGNLVAEGEIGGTDPLENLIVNGNSSIHADITTTDAQTFNGAVVLTSDVVLTSTGAGSVTFASTIDSSAGNLFSLTVNTAGITQFNGSIGLTDRLSGLTTDAAGQSNINATNINTNGNGVTFGDAVLLQSDVSIDEDGAGNVVFNSTIDAADNAGAGSNFGLTVTTNTGSTTFNGNVGSDSLAALSDPDGLEFLTVNGPGFIGGNVTTTGTQTFNGPAVLTADVTFGGITATTIFNSTLDSSIGNNFAAIFNSALITNAAVGGIDALSSLTANNTASLGGNVTTTGNQFYFGSVTLTANVITTSTASGTIGFNAVDGTTAGTESLTINTTGSTFLGNPGQNIGTSVALESITTDAPGTTTIFANLVTTTGTQTYNDVVDIRNPLVLTGSTITFADTVDSSLTAPVDIVGNLVAEGEIGGINPLQFLTVSGTSSLHADITTEIFQTYSDAVTLTSDVVLTSNNGGNITFGSTIDSSAGNLFSLTLNSIGFKTFNGIIGGTDRLSGLTSSAGGQTVINTGTINTNGNGVTIGDAVQLQTDVVIDEIGAGNVTFNSTVDALDNGGAGSDVSLTVNTTTGTTSFNGNVGSNALGAVSDIDGLEFVTINGLVNISGNITTSGEQNFNGDATLTNSVTLSAIDDGDADPFDVRFAGTLNGGGFNLNIIDCVEFVGAVFGLGDFVTDGLTTRSTFSAASITALGITCPIEFGGDVTTGGDVNLGGNITLTNDLSIITKGDGVVGDINFAPGTVLNGNEFDLLLFADNITIGDNSTFTFTNVGPVVGDFTAITCRAFTLGSAASINTLSGNVVINANQEQVINGGEFIGISLNSNSAIVSQFGNITLAGRGGDSATPNANRGIQAIDATVSTTSTGAISMTGTTQVTNSESVVLFGPAMSVTTVNGPITITGNGATNTNSVELVNGTNVTSDTGIITVQTDADLLVDGLNTNVQTTVGNIIFQSGGSTTISNDANIQTDSGQISLTSFNDTTIAGPATFVQTNTGNIAINANGSTTASIVMNGDSVVRSNLGNIDLTAYNNVRLGLVNSDFDADGTAGIIQVTADSNGDGIGFIADNTAGETDADSNLTGQTFALRAGNGIGEAVSFNTAANIDIRASFGPSVTVAAINGSNSIGISATEDMVVGSVAGVSGISNTIQTANSDIYLRAAGSITVSSGITNSSVIGGVFVNGEGTTDDDFVTIQSDVRSGQEVLINSGNDVNLLQNAIVQSTEGGVVQVVAGSFEVAPVVFQQGNTDANITMQEGTAIASTDGQVTLIAANNILLSEVNAGFEGNAYIAANRQIAADGSQLNAGTDGSIFDNTVAESTNITSGSVSFAAAQSIGQLTFEDVNGNRILDPGEDLNGNNKLDLNVNPELDINIEVAFLDSALIDQLGGQINLSDPSDLIMANPVGTALVQAKGGQVKLDVGGTFFSSFAVIDVSDYSGIVGQIDIDATNDLLLTDTILDASVDPATVPVGMEATQSLVQLYGGQNILLDGTAIDTRTNPVLNNNPDEILAAFNNVELLVGANEDESIDPNSIDDVIVANSIIVTDFSLTDSVRPDYSFLLGFPVTTTAPIMGNIVFEGLFVGGLSNPNTTNVLVTVDWDDFSDLTMVLPEGAPSNSIGAAPNPTDATSLGVDVNIVNPAVTGLFDTATFISAIQNPANTVRGFNGAGALPGPINQVSGLGFADTNVLVDSTSIFYRHLYSQQDVALTNVNPGSPVGDITGINVPIDDYFGTFQQQNTSRSGPESGFNLGITASLNNSIIVARDQDGDRELTIDSANGNFAFENEDPLRPNDTSPDILLSKQVISRSIPFAGAFSPIVTDEEVIADEADVQQIEPFAELIVQLPDVTNDNGNAAAGSSSGQGNRFELRILSPDPNKRFTAEIDLPENIIEGDNRLKLFQGLDDNRYQLVFIKSDGTERIVIEVDVIQGQPITRFDNLEETIEGVKLIPLDVDGGEATETDTDPGTTQAVPPIDEGTGGDIPPELESLIPVSQSGIVAPASDFSKNGDLSEFSDNWTNNAPITNSYVSEEETTEPVDSNTGIQAATASLAAASVLGRRERRRARLEADSNQHELVLDKKQRRRQRLFGDTL